MFCVNKEKLDKIERNLNSLYKNAVNRGYAYCLRVTNDNIKRKRLRVPKLGRHEVVMHVGDTGRQIKRYEEFGRNVIGHGSYHIYDRETFSKEIKAVLKAKYRLVPGTKEYFVGEPADVFNTFMAFYYLYMSSFLEENEEIEDEGEDESEEDESEEDSNIIEFENGEAQCAHCLTLYKDKYAVDNHIKNQLKDCSDNPKRNVCRYCNTGCSSSQFRKEHEKRCKSRSKSVKKVKKIEEECEEEEEEEGEEEAEEYEEEVEKTPKKRKVAKNSPNKKEKRYNDKGKEIDNCEFCGEEMLKNSLPRHKKDSCQEAKLQGFRVETEEELQQRTCSYCDEPKANKNGRKIHEKICKKNPKNRR